MNDKENKQTINNTIMQLRAGTIGDYVLSAEHIGAIQAAWFTQRPLLVRGDPGQGKTRLAYALAEHLEWGLVKSTVQYNSNIDDLLYSIDHLERLFVANQKHENGQGQEALSLSKNGQDQETLSLSKFVRPGKIWQAMAPSSLESYGCNKPHNKAGTVLLIDEIDKADATLPNALLEVLDEKRISLPFEQKAIEKDLNQGLFVVITSNEERQLPKAFLRRCAVLELALKKEGDGGGIQQLQAIYKAHYPQSTLFSEECITQVAQAVLDERAKRQESEYKPGTSEFLDLLKVLAKFPEPQREEQLKLFSQHLLLKHK